MSTEHPLRRLFFALWPSSEMRDALAEATRKQIVGVNGKAIPPENFHFTLAFLGSMDDRRVPELEPIAETVALAFARRVIPPEVLDEIARNPDAETIPDAVVALPMEPPKTDGDVDGDAPAPDPRVVGADVALSALTPTTGVPIAVTLDHIEHWARPEILCATTRETPTAAIALADALKSELVAHGFVPDLKLFRPHATLARKVRRVTRELHMEEPVHWSFGEFELIESHSHPSSGSIYSSCGKWPLDRLLR